ESVLPVPVVARHALHGAGHQEAESKSKQHGGKRIAPNEACHTVPGLAGIVTKARSDLLSTLFRALPGFASLFRGRGWKFLGLFLDAFNHSSGGLLRSPRFGLPLRT